MKPRPSAGGFRFELSGVPIRGFISFQTEANGRQSCGTSARRFQFPGWPRSFPPPDGGARIDAANLPYALIHPYVRVALKKIIVKLLDENPLPQAEIVAVHDGKPLPPQLKVGKRAVARDAEPGGIPRTGQCGRSHCCPRRMLTGGRQIDRGCVQIQRRRSG